MWLRLPIDLTFTETMNKALLSKAARVTPSQLFFNDICNLAYWGD